MDINKIPLTSVRPSPMNPRKTFDEEDLQELADNIEKQGLLQPITVRPSGDGKFEIVCGERRYRAFTLLKAKEDKTNAERTAAHRKKSDKFQGITAIVREMTDEEAFDAMITENLQRKDVDPIEEAFAFGQLSKAGKSAEEIAARFGKSVRFVTERIKLNTLIPELMVAVKDEKMPIVAASIICKLDEEQQRNYYNSYQVNINGYTKATAQNFVDNLFMSIDKSLWYQSDNLPDEEFEGSCGVKCSECPRNTANHGCLFYETKCDNAGRCTDRDRFQAKTIDYIMHEIERQGDHLVRVGEPLEYGRSVLAIRIDSNEHESTKDLKHKISGMINTRGFEVVDPSKTFSSRCYYGADDERTLNMLQSGEVYSVINLFNYNSPTISEEFWYVKKKSAAEPSDALPTAAASLLGQIKAENDGLRARLVTECAKTMYGVSKPTNEPLAAIEQQLFCLLMLQSDCRLRKAVGLNEYLLPDREDAYIFIADNPHIFNQCARAWLQSKISRGNNAELFMAEPMFDALGALWCAEEYNKTVAKVIDKHDKAVYKLKQQLASLGYDCEGNPIDKGTPVETANK